MAKIDVTFRNGEPIKIYTTDAVFEVEEDTAVLLDTMNNTVSDVTEEEVEEIEALSFISECDIESYS